MDFGQTAFLCMIRSVVELIRRFRCSFVRSVLTVLDMGNIGMKLFKTWARSVRLALLLLFVALLLVACGGRNDDPPPTAAPAEAVSAQEEPTAPPTDTPAPTVVTEPNEGPVEEQPESPLEQVVSPLAQPQSPLAQPESPLDAPGD